MQHHQVISLISALFFLSIWTPKLRAVVRCYGHQIHDSAVTAATDDSTKLTLEYVHQWMLLLLHWHFRKICRNFTATLFISSNFLHTIWRSFARLSVFLEDTKLKQNIYENKVSVSSTENGTRNSGSANPGNRVSVGFWEVVNSINLAWWLEWGTKYVLA
jgi:hypothetical protein